MNWIAFFSQTGSEILDICNHIKRKPNLLVTNNFEEKIKINPGIKELDVTIQSGKHDLLMTYFRNQGVFDPEETLITLHGYLRIIPGDLCYQYTILNGHPGLISLYPELKGKDPQVRAWEGRYMLVGSVVHKVTPEVDEGRVLSAASYPNDCKSLDEMYGLLKKCSLESWLGLLKNYEDLGCALA